MKAIFKIEAVESISSKMTIPAKKEGEQPTIASITEVKVMLTAIEQEGSPLKFGRLKILCVDENESKNFIMDKEFSIEIKPL